MDSPPQNLDRENPHALAVKASRVEAINAILPQTQCQRCGYAACKPYAQAIVDGQADINRCPPGGRHGIVKLAEITGKPIKPLDPTCGVEGPLRKVRIDEDRCIGCALCIPACPVDAIVGAFKFLHSVVEDDCTGCGLCIAPCPVDCIDWREPASASEWTSEDARKARLHFENKERRLAQTSSGPPRLNSNGLVLSGSSHDDQDQTKKQDAILQAARARVRQKKESRRPS